MFGSVLGPSSQRANEVRIGAFLAGFPETVPVHTVNRYVSRPICGDYSPLLQAVLIRASGDCLCRRQHQGRVLLTSDCWRCRDNEFESDGMGRKHQSPHSENAAHTELLDANGLFESICVIKQTPCL